MNCKQGDLAVIVRSTCGNEGRFVTCISLIPMHSFLQPDGRIIIGPSWVVEPPIFGWLGDKAPGVRDALLRPIRYNDGEDEILSIVGHPQPALV